MSPDLAALTVSVTDGAELVGLSARRLQQLAVEGWIPKAERGRYPLAGLVQGAQRFHENERSAATKSAGDSRVRDARAAEIELRMEEKRGTLKLLAEEHGLALLDHVLGPLRADVYAVPARTTKDLALRRRVEIELDTAFTAAADRATAFRTGAPPPSPNRADRRSARHASAR